MAARAQPETWAPLFMLAEPRDTRATRLCTYESTQLVCRRRRRRRSLCGQATAAVAPAIPRALLHKSPLAVD